MIYVENKKRKFERICADYPNAIIVDITSNSRDTIILDTPFNSREVPAKILSPFYPHGNIPIPFSNGMTASCVEAVWQGLKVFQEADVNIETFKNDAMKDLKRTVRKYGAPLGHRKGVYGKELLSYFDARMQIYLPTYKWVLDNVPEVHDVVMEIKAKAQQSDIVLLDYNINIDFRDITKPLSHAGLVKLYIEGHYPEFSKGYSPMTKEELEEKRERLKLQKKEIKKKAKQAPKIEERTLFDIN